MLVFMIVEAGAALYAGMYGWNCMRKRRPLATTGAALLFCFGLLMGALLLIFTV